MRMLTVTMVMVMMEENAGSLESCHPDWSGAEGASSNVSKEKEKQIINVLDV